MLGFLAPTLQFLDLFGNFEVLDRQADPENLSLLIRLPSENMAVVAVVVR